MFKFIKNFFARRKNKTVSDNPDKKVHIEKDTECDKCNRLHECIASGILLEFQSLEDTKMHYIRGWNESCPSPFIYDRIIDENGVDG